MPDNETTLWVPATAVLTAREDFNNWLERAGPGKLVLARLDSLFPEVEGATSEASLSRRAVTFLGSIIGDVIANGFRLTQVGTGPQATDVVEFGVEDGEARK